MAVTQELDAKYWEEQLELMPDKVAELARQFPPNRLYKLHPTGQRVEVVCWGEDQSVAIFLSGEYHLLTFERIVFGVMPEYLEECDLPGPEEVTGALLTTDEQIKDYLDRMKAQNQSVGEDNDGGWTENALEEGEYELNICGEDGSDSLPFRGAGL